MTVYDNLYWIARLGHTSATEIHRRMAYELWTRSYLLFTHIKCDATELLLKRIPQFLLNIATSGTYAPNAYVYFAANFYFHEGTCFILIENHFFQIGDCWISVEGQQPDINHSASFLTVQTKCAILTLKCALRVFGFWFFFSIFP